MPKACELRTAVCKCRSLWSARSIGYDSMLIDIIIVYIILFSLVLLFSSKRKQVSYSVAIITLWLALIFSGGRYQVYNSITLYFLFAIIFFIILFWIISYNKNHTKMANYFYPFMNLVVAPPLIAILMIILTEFFYKFLERC